MKKFTKLILLTMAFMFSSVLTYAQCGYQIELTDSYGDGWNGGSVSVYVDGATVISGATLSSGSGPLFYNFSVTTGAEITTTYIPGSWSYENNYRILDAAGVAVFETGYPNGTPTSLGQGILFGNCPVLGDLEGYVMNGDGLSIAGATVWMDGYPSVTTDPTGFYQLLQVTGENQDVTAWKEGYNVTTDNIYITVGGTTSHNFTLTKPSLTINPLFFDETLNPGEYLTT